MSKELIRLRDLTMEFDGERILDGINLYINDHEYFSIRFAKDASNPPPNFSCGISRSMMVDVQIRLKKKA